jgi:hypothetical protein
MSITLDMGHSLGFVDKDVAQKLADVLSAQERNGDALPIPPSAHAALWQPVYTIS